MHRAIPAALITAAAFVLVWQFEPHPDTVTALPQTPAAASGSAPGTSGQQVLDGTAVATRWGTVQVRAVFIGGKLTDIQMLQTPNDRHATRAIPTLKAEALKAQSANIDTVSGATATSEAYAQSLQTAIDQRS
jgi:uncharacterized protein with FMN-binding domain